MAVFGYPAGTPVSSRSSYGVRCISSRTTAHSVCRQPSQLHISLANLSCGNLDPRFFIYTQDNRQVEWPLFVGGVELEITCQEIREGSNASDSAKP